MLLSLGKITHGVHEERSGLFMLFGFAKSRVRCQKKKFMGAGEKIYMKVILWEAEMKKENKKEGRNG